MGNESTGNTAGPVCRDQETSPRGQHTLDQGGLHEEASLGRWDGKVCLGILQFPAGQTEQLRWQMGEDGLVSASWGFIIILNHTVGVGSLLCQVARLGMETGY